jgi:6-phosphofructokinase
MNIISVFGGGHVKSFPAGFYGLAGHALNNKDKVYLAFDGWDGLIKNELVPVTSANLDDLIKSQRAVMPSGSLRIKLKDDDISRIIENYKDKDAVIVVFGGDDNLGEAVKIMDRGVRTMGWDKTMDNDKNVPLICFGYDSFVRTAVRETLGAKDQAMTNRAFVWNGVFARDTDFVPALAAYYGMADLMIGGEGRNSGEIKLGLIAERVGQVLSENEQRYGVRFGTGVCSEGAVNIEGFSEFLEGIKQATSHMPLRFNVKYDALNHPKLQPELLCMYLNMITDQLVGAKGQYLTVTYSGRNGRPSKFDLKWGQMAGVHIVDAIHSGDYGKCAVVEYNDPRFAIKMVSLKQAAMKRTLAQVSDEKGIKPVDYRNLCVTEDAGKLYPMVFGVRPDPGKYMPDVRKRIQL